MKILVATGIYPPDIGGPATHAADLRAELTARGHDITVLTLGDEPSGDIDADVVRLPRSAPWPIRHARVIFWMVGHRRRFDVVYATGLSAAAVAGAKLARRPVALKIVGDAAWERGARRGLTGQDFEDFQRSRSGGPALRAMRWLRDWSCRHADAVITPSAHLARAASAWGRRDDVAVIPNGARGALARSRPDVDPEEQPRLVFVGRLIPLKRVDLLIDAVAAHPTAVLDVVGDGPDLERLSKRAVAVGVSSRVLFSGRHAHDEVVRRIADADALVLASSHEGLPHVVIEALVLGTPVLSTRVGGVGEVIEDGVNGLICAPNASAFTHAFDRLVHESTLGARLRDGARRSGLHWRFEACADRVEAILAALQERPVAVFVGKSKTPTRPRPDDVRKYTINERHVHTVVICTADRFGVQRPGGAMVIGLPARRMPGGSAAFYAGAPLLGLVLALWKRPSAIVCQSPYEAVSVVLARALLPRRVRPPLQIELHGDWRTASRLYGSSRRRLVAGLSDRVAEWTLRRADRVRPVSEVLAARARTAGFGGPLDRYVAYSDYSGFLEAPLAPVPPQPSALFVGVFERYKAIDVLLDAWPAVVQAVPRATLTMVGSGSLDHELRERVQTLGLEDGIRVVGPVPRAELLTMMDASSCLVLPSRSEGLARVVLEAMARGRAVVASRVGGIEEVVADGRNGRIVEAEDVGALVAALVEVLDDREKASRMGTESRRRITERDPQAEYEAGISRMAVWIRAPHGHTGEAVVGS